MDDAELLSRLNRLAEVEPATAATERALIRVRDALMAAPGPKRRSYRLITRLSAVAATAVAIAIAAWLFIPSAAGRAFADVREKVNQTRSVSMTYGPRDAQKLDRAHILADGRMRIEDADGKYTVIDPTAGVSLAVDPAKKEAVIIRGYHHRGPTNVYDLLREIRNDRIRKLPSERIDGRAVEVFVAKLSSGSGMEATVWVDAVTQLPLRIEFPGPDGGAVMRAELEFDRKLDAALFSTEPPAGHAVRREGVENPPAVTRDQRLFNLTVTPTEGIGPVKFGMSMQQVTDLLGKPDKLDQRGTAMDYLSRGYSLIVSPRRGVMMIHCYTQATFVVKVKDFAGATREGISMGASEEGIVKAYGQPDHREKEEVTTRLRYARLGLEFTLFNDRLVQFSASAMK